MADALDALFKDLPPRLSVEQLTEVLGLADPTITYRWLRDGTVPAMKLGKRWLILRDDVKEHLRGRYNTPPPTRADPSHKPD
ncbi:MULTISPECIES: helix-turn-helix domain-containing protein [Kocuria]|uniref:helix-turn-helix domain-containing protein n=1 Tax=Kocuria TaxID=57493 RepID=UPI0022E75BAA|nr:MULTISPECIES: helix-turn-helix domain-containing protein [Kocuria]